MFICQDELVPMIEDGVVGFKCFLIHSGVDEFPCVDESQVDLALEKLKGTSSVLAVSQKTYKTPVICIAEAKFMIAIIVMKICSFMLKSRRLQVMIRPKIQTNMKLS